MLFFLIYCFSFILLLSKSFSFKQHPPMNSEWKFLSSWFWEGLSGFIVTFLQKGWFGSLFYQVDPKGMPFMKKMRTLGLKLVENAKEENEKEIKAKVSLLDLPELTLECIFEKLSPAGLCSMAGVCTSLRDKCSSDHFWEKHMKQKWTSLIGDVAYREWHCHVNASKRTPATSLDQNKPKLFFRCLNNSIWPLSLIISPKVESDKPRSISLPVDSVMALYLSLESGEFWFPAQVYNRENGHIGFMLSCYDAKLSYDSRTGNFLGRYSPHGRRTVEENISWDRIRVPPVDTPSHVRHISDCLHDLKPGDHIEIQWRRNKEFPYGWWYGVVGHLDYCDGNEKRCCCHSSDTVILEFNQYSPESIWRQTIINRKDHKEVGNEADGFYGGIRKLYKEEEISTWKGIWPTQVLE